MKRSLIGRLNLLIKRFTLVSLFFVLAVAFSFGFASYRVDMKNTADESRMLATWLKDFRSLTFRETDVRGTAYALFDDGVLYVNRRQGLRRLQGRPARKRLYLFARRRDV